MNWRRSRLEEPADLLAAGIRCRFLFPNILVLSCLPYGDAQWAQEVLRTYSIEAMETMENWRCRVLTD